MKQIFILLQRREDKGEEIEGGKREAPLGGINSFLLRLSPSVLLKPLSFSTKF